MRAFTLKHKQKFKIKILTGSPKFEFFLVFKYRTNIYSFHVRLSPFTSKNHPAKIPGILPKIFAAIHSHLLKIYPQKFINRRRATPRRQTSTESGTPRSRLHNGKGKVNSMTRASACDEETIERGSLNRKQQHQ